MLKININIERLNKIKRELGKNVFFKSTYFKKPKNFILNGYTIRINPKNNQEIIAEAELLDRKNSECGNGSIIIARIEDIILETEQGSQENQKN